MCSGEWREKFIDTNCQPRLDLFNMKVLCNKYLYIFDYRCYKRLSVTKDFLFNLSAIVVTVREEEREKMIFCRNIDLDGEGR